MSAAVEEELVREIQLANGASGTEKAERLRRVRDMLLKPSLRSKMSTYFPLLLEFRDTHDPAEKQLILELVMDCADAVPDFGLLTAAIGFIRQMLNDAFPSVVKAALLASRRLIRVSLHALCSSAESEDSKRLMWGALKGVVDNIIAPDLTAHRLVGIRMLTLKLIQQLALIMSASHSPAPTGQTRGSLLSTTFPFVKELKELAAKCKQLLLQHARPPNLLKLPVPLQLVALNCLASFACIRHDSLEEAISVLMQAANIFKDIRPDAGVSKASARKACVDAFLLFLKADDPALLSQEEKVCRGLQIMSESTLAQDTIKRRKTQRAKAERAKEREPAAAEDQPPASRVKVNPFEPLPQHRAAVDRAAEQVPRLLVQSGITAVSSFIDSMDMNVLVELIISRMVHLPPQSPPDHLSAEGCLKLQLERCAAILGPEFTKPEPLGTPPGSPPKEEETEVPKQPEVETKPAVPPKPAKPPRPQIHATFPSPGDCLFVQQSAVRRILKAPATLAPYLRTSMASKLARNASGPEGQELLKCFKDLLQTDMRSALDLALSWLFVLFIRQCTRLPPTAAEPSGDTADASTVAATVYLSGLESVLSTILDTTSPEDRLPNKLPPVTVLLTEVPLLPETIARKRLEWLFNRGGGWGKVALFAMRELIKSKHVLKPVMLKLAIKQLLIMRDGELKDQTIKMLANQAYPVLNPDEAEEVESAAVKLLVDFVDHRPPPPPVHEEELTEKYKWEMSKMAENACKLLTALCTKRTSLVERLWSLYLEENQDPFLRKAVLESSHKVGKVVSPDGRRAMSLIEAASKEAAPLVLQLVSGMLAQLSGVPASPLVDASMQAYQRSNDLKLLALVMPGMPKEQAKQYAPLLVKLIPVTPGGLEEFKEAVRRLVTGVGGRREPALSPRELLLLYHTVNHSSVGLSLKELGVAVTECIQMKDVFDRDTATHVLGRLVEMEPLPQLIMRTLINVWHGHPDMQRYLVTTIATRLIARRSYDDGVLWTGFKMFASFAMETASIGPTCELLLQLPPEKLGDLLKSPRHVEHRARQRLADYVGRLPDRFIDGSIMRVLAT